MAVIPIPLVEKGHVTPPGVGWWGSLESESTPELQWPLSVLIYDQMRRQDTQVASVLRAVTLPVRRTPWRIKAAGARDEVVQFVADELGLPIVGVSDEEEPAPARRRDRFSWGDHLRTALLMLPFGHSYFEQVYRIDGARAPGSVHIRKLSPRPSRTIAAFNVDDDGGLVSIEQSGLSSSKTVELPVDVLVAYIHEKEGANWLGTSLLRPAYKNWLIKDRLLRTQAQTIDRNGMGVPRYTGAEGETDLSAGLDIAKAWRAGDNSGAAVPFGARLDLVGVEGDLPDADKPIRYHDESIARAVLAHFLNLGTQTGSWALGTTFADFFVMSLQTVAETIADVASQHVVEDLIDVNWGEDEPAPRVVHDEIGAQQTATAAALKLLRDAGILLPDRSLEEAIRQQYGLPPKDAARPTPAPAADPIGGPP